MISKHKEKEENEKENDLQVGWDCSKIIEDKHTAGVRDQIKEEEKILPLAFN